MGFESFNSIPPQEEPPKQSAPKIEIPKNLFSKDPYEVLGIPKTANTKQIEDAKKNLQRKFHPDINNDPKAKEVSQNINNAFDILKGDKKHAVLGERPIPRENNEEINKERIFNEIITTATEIEIGIFVPNDFFVKVMEYGRLRNVRVNFYIKRGTPFSRIYKVEFKGKRKNIAEVVNYIKNRPRVNL